MAENDRVEFQPYLGYAVAVLQVSLGNYEAALERATVARAAAYQIEDLVLLELVEAAARTDLRELAASVVDEMARRAWLDRLDEAAATCHAPRGLSCTGETAAAAPLGARVHLRAAHEISFHRAVGSADRARRELAATGEPVGGPQAALPTQRVWTSTGIGWSSRTSFYDWVTSVPSSKDHVTVVGRRVLQRAVGPVARVDLVVAGDEADAPHPLRRARVEGQGLAGGVTVGSPGGARVTVDRVGRCEARRRCDQ
jgi:hypothetical protein